MGPGDLVYTCHRKSEDPFMLPVSYQLESDLQNKGVVQAVRHIECGTPCIVIDSVNPCMVLSRRGIIYVQGYDLADEYQYREILERAKSKKFVIQPMKIPTSGIFYLDQERLRKGA